MKVFGLFLFLFNVNFAQNTGKLSGIVTDAETGEPLVGSNVVILGTNLGAATDLDGRYFILNIPPGKYEVQVSMVGYNKAIQTGVIINSGMTTNLNFKLKPAILEQAVVVIEATRPDVEPEKTSTSMIIRTDEVQQIAGMRNVGNVIGLSADVVGGHFRGGRSNEELYLLQGLSFNNPLDNSRAFTPIMSALEEVEVVTSGFSAKYGNAQSGVVNITMKEGKSDKWRTYADMRIRLPQRKHFGSSVYDVNANQYLQTYLNIDEWVKHYATVTQTQLGQDSLLKIEVSRLSWLQARRYMNRNYGNDIDNDVELSTGGPLSERMRMFFAFSKNTSYPIFPTQKPDENYQVMGNIVTDVWRKVSLKLSYAYARSRSNSFSIDDYRDFLWDMINGVGTNIQTNYQLGLRFTHALSHSTFYLIEFGYLGIDRKSGGGVYVPDSVLNTVANPTGNWIGKLNRQPDLFGEGPSGGGFSRNKVNTYSINASITSQVTPSHLINAGIQLNIYDLYVDRWANRSLTGNIRPIFQGYKAKPWETGIYIEDKMEFQGLIANVGLRFDVWNQNRRYQPNPFVDQTIDTGKVKTPIIGRLQPRIGISFPVMVNTVFHLNYGSFMQRPGFQYMYQYEPGIAAKGSGTFGNPSLKPQVTYMYDVGVTQGIGKGITFDVSGYYKNVKDLIERAIYFYNYNFSFDGTPIPGGTYSTYINRDYADIRGFRLSLSKRKGSLTGSINYQYSVATGKSSAPGNASPIIGINTEDTKNVPKRDILLDFDRTHNLVINIGYSTGDNWGFKIGDVYPLENITMSIYSTARSGRPYTYNPAGISAREAATMNMRMPAEYNTNIKITKRINNFIGYNTTIYLEIFNLFNDKTLNYDYITNLSAAYLKDFHTKPLDAPDGLKYNDEIIKGNMEYGFDHSFILYNNQPRSFTLGIIVDF